MRVSRECATLMLALYLASCGGGDANTSEEDAAASDAAATGESAPAGQPGTASTNAPVAVEDIDRWQRGMEAELRAVQEAAARFRNAKTGEDSVNAMMGANDQGTLAAGASAAGLNEERYRFIRTNLSTATSYLSPLEQEMNISQLPPATVEEMQRNREASLAQMSNDVPSAVVDALRPRAAALRRQDLTLTGERLKAMTAGE